MPYTDEELKEFLKKDEDDIRSAIEFIRKNPVKLKPKLSEIPDPDYYRLHALSYKRHNQNRDSIKIDWEFHDKRFEELLGDDY